MMKPGRPVHPSNGAGTAPDAAVTPSGVLISFDLGSNRDRQTTGAVLVTNREAGGGNTLEVSFSNGRYWFAVATDTTIEFPVMVHSCRLRGTSGATAIYSIMGIIF